MFTRVQENFLLSVPIYEFETKKTLLHNQNFRVNRIGCRTICKKSYVVAQQCFKRLCKNNVMLERYSMTNKAEILKEY